MLTKAPCIIRYSCNTCITHKFTIQQIKNGKYMVAETCPRIYIGVWFCTKVFLIASFPVEIRYIHQ